jgi:uncharacterized protein YjiS (DUF1127 family)
MTTITTNAPARTAAGTGLRALVQTFLRRRAVERQVYAELSALTERELADIGLHSGMIAQVARESARAA